MNKQVHLTDAVCKGHPPPASGYDLLRDDKVTGLCLRVTSGGSRSFTYDGRLHGQMYRKTFGPYGEGGWNVAQARKAAQALRGAQGAPKSTRGEPTLRELYDRFMEDHARPHLKSWSEYESLYKHTFPKVWLGMKASAIDPSDVVRWHKKLGRENGEYRANRAMALLSAIYGKARAWKLITCESPTKDIEKFREAVRKRRVSVDELRRLNDALIAETDPYWKAYFPLLLYLGARRSELLKLRWENVHLDESLLVLVDTKSGEDVELPLPPAAQAIFESLPSRGTEWVFPAERGGSGYRTEPKKAWQRIKARAGVENLRIHDLRHVVGTRLGDLGFAETTIAATLGHRNVATTRRYVHPGRSTVRAALAANAAELQRLLAAPANGVAVEEADGDGD